MADIILTRYAEQRPRHAANAYGRYARPAGPIRANDARRREMKVEYLPQMRRHFFDEHFAEADATPRKYHARQRRHAAEAASRQRLSRRCRKCSSRRPALTPLFRRMRKPGMPPRAAARARKRAPCRCHFRSRTRKANASTSLATSAGFFGHADA